MSGFAITIPKTTSWVDFERELADLGRGLVKNYRLGRAPKAIHVEDAMYIVHDGVVRGHLTVHAFVNKPTTWNCETTGNVMNAGWYMQLVGPWCPTPPWPMEGFRGYRAFTPPEAS